VWLIQAASPSRFAKMRSASGQRLYRCARGRSAERRPTLAGNHAPAVDVYDRALSSLERCHDLLKDAGAVLDELEARLTKELQRRIDGLAEGEEDDA
jgi:hypothetical protein